MDVVSVAIIGVLAMVVVLMAVDLVYQARRFEEVSGWRLKCMGFVPVVIALTSGIPFVLDSLIGQVSLLPGHRLGLVGGTIVGIVVSELVIYWVHRLHHNVDVLWRWVHQLHHSAERVDVFGAAYFHPFEIIEGTVLGVLFFVGFLGLTPEAAALSILWQAFNGVFQHGNIRTPRWLGYVIQRPEAHGVHHERGLHAYNYANLPLWDIVFGTFRNPQVWEGVAGFYAGASKQTIPMLLGRDVSRSESRS